MEWQHEADLRDVLSSSNPGFNNLAVGYNESVGNTSVSLRRTKDEAIMHTIEKRWNGKCTSKGNGIKKTCSER